MRTILITLASLIVLSLHSNAQQASLVADQNPRYEGSRAKYMNMSDSLTSNQGTTIQETYKAYDWYENREAKRKLRRETNYQNSLVDYSFYGGPFFYPTLRYNNFGYRNYGNGYRNYNRGSHFGW
ncbi:hypothetical protein ACVWYN_002963 [Pedobacter sp. UYP24]